MNHRLEKAAHWYRLKRFGFIPEPEYPAGIASIMVGKMSLSSCLMRQNMSVHFPVNSEVVHSADHIDRRTTKLYGLATGSEAASILTWIPSTAITCQRESLSTHNSSVFSFESLSLLGNYCGTGGRSGPRKHRESFSSCCCDKNSLSSWRQPWSYDICATLLRWLRS
jgi:hypothetical protein